MFSFAAGSQRSQLQRTYIYICTLVPFVPPMVTHARKCKMSLTFSLSRRNDLVRMQGNLGGGAAGVHAAPVEPAGFRNAVHLRGLLHRKIHGLPEGQRGPGVRGPARAGRHAPQRLTSTRSGLLHLRWVQSAAVRLCLPLRALPGRGQGPSAWLVPQLVVCNMGVANFGGFYCQSRHRPATLQESPSPCNTTSWIERVISDYEKWIVLCWKGWICFEKVLGAFRGDPFIFLFFFFKEISFLMWIQELFLTYWIPVFSAKISLAFPVQKLFSHGKIGS